MTDRNLTMARQIALRVREAGGSAYFVGGFVRDRLLGLENKDIDIEVHRVSPEALERILDSLGERINMGESFGVMGLRHYDLDIAMPRSETATGRGHRDFTVLVDPDLGERKAAMRRDFTVNAMMEDVLTHEVLDFFGGQEDLREGRLRHVNDESFPEDPLRVFRACQFAARFGFHIAPETAALCSGMAVDALARERVFGELEKALRKAERPSTFFQDLRQMSQLSCWFPELEALIGVPQGSEHHPEGDVWIHTMQVLDEAAKLREQAQEPLWLLLSALCHDFGKAVTTRTVEGKIHAYGHETRGLPLVEVFLDRLVNEVRLREYVLNMTQLHMLPNMKAASGCRDLSFMKLFDSAVCPEDLLLLAEADFLGRQGRPADAQSLEREYRPTKMMLREKLSLYHERMARPCVMGRDLITAGMRPGPVFSEALAYAHNLHLAGIPKDEQLRQTLGQFRKSLRGMENDTKKE